MLSKLMANVGGIERVFEALMREKVSGARSPSTTLPTTGSNWVVSSPLAV